ncbi:hypothetical protein NQ314_013810 [Rhamnusium bicolor]|uniref:Ribosomal protein n=1 Tax=Rhamnusium bicolor TaxID=1586634 RepID=A0AAV8X447_9CUCU|nr:hypothetical protein NQ314_013810 [Rhamnusium bicolor]
MMLWKYTIMLPIFRNVLFNVSKRVNSNSNLAISSAFHLLSKQSITNVPQQFFLKPVTQNVIQSCGFKVMGLVKRRCKDCYLVRRQERLYNICKTHPRHKQMSMVKDVRHTWILTHATQSKVRPW